jgi:Tol biopolymer transport system component
MRTGLSRSYIYTSDQLADGVIITSKIANYAVTTPKIGDYSVGTTQLNGMIINSRAKAYLSADQSYSAITDTKVQFDTKVFDPGSRYDNTTNYRYTVYTYYAGQYVVHAQLKIAGRASAGYIIAKIFKNGAQVTEHIRPYAGDSQNFKFDALSVLDLIAGDYIEIFIYDTQGGTIKGGSGMSYFEIYRLP